MSIYRPPTKRNALIIIGLLLLWIGCATQENDYGSFGRIRRLFGGWPTIRATGVVIVRCMLLSSRVVKASSADWTPILFPACPAFGRSGVPVPFLSALQHANAADSHVDLYDIHIRHCKSPRVPQSCSGGSHSKRGKGTLALSHLGSLPGKVTSETSPESRSCCTAPAVACDTRRSSVLRLNRTISRYKQHQQKRRVTSGQTVKCSRNGVLYRDNCMTLKCELPPTDLHARVPLPFKLVLLHSASSVPDLDGQRIEYAGILPQLTMMR